MWNALNTLPEIQNCRVDYHLILEKTYREITLEESVDKSAIQYMKKYLQENL